MGYERSDRRYGRDTYGPGQGYGYGARDRGYRPNAERSNYDRGYGQGTGYGNRQERDDYRRSYGADRPPGDYDYDDRGFFDRAGDEVRSWFGDEEAERRRRYDERNDTRYAESHDRDRGPRWYEGAAFGAGFVDPLGFGYYSPGDNARRRNAPSAYVSRDTRGSHDPDYSSWRDRQMADYDRDYEEYRRENQSRFDTEFGQWREGRAKQRGSLREVKEHQEVLGSDGAHVGTVDHVRGDRILLTKNETGTGGHHHSIPCSWIESVDAKAVHIRKTAEEAHNHWRDEDRNRGLFGDRNEANGPHVLNRSFSGTY